MQLATVVASRVDYPEIGKGGCNLRRPPRAVPTQEPPRGGAQPRDNTETI